MFIYNTHTSCMHAYRHECTYIYTHMYTYFYICFTCVYIYIYISIYIHWHIHLYVFTYLHIHTCWTLVVDEISNFSVARIGTTVALIAELPEFPTFSAVTFRQQVKKICICKVWWCVFNQGFLRFMLDIICSSFLNMFLVWCYICVVSTSIINVYDA
jgi:hypothetical protein